MPVFTIPIHENNDCHLPAGSSAGGQFCSDDDLAGPGPEGFQHGHPSAQAKALAGARKRLMRASFEEGPVRETMMVVDADGAHVHSMLVGDETSVHVDQSARRLWIADGPVVTAHTHPGSSTFSFDDFYFHNSVNRQGRAENPKGPLAVKAMQVYGEDGSWYEIQFTRVLDTAEIAQVRKDFDMKLSMSRRQADTATTKWAQEQSWWATRPPKTWELMNETEHVRHAAEKAKTLDTLEAQHARYFRDKAQHIWTGIAAQFGFHYRYHLAD